MTASELRHLAGRLCLVEPHDYEDRAITEAAAAFGNEIPARGRLFALGFDAWRLQTLLRGNGIAGSVDGLTGQLAQDAARRVHRTLEWARIDDGVPKPLEP